MNITIILAHPDPNSFNHAIAKTCRQILQSKGCTIFYHDLYEEKFDSLMPAEEFPKEAALPNDLIPYCEEILNSDGIIIVHPNWWSMPPAILKGWIDRVLRPGVAYQFLEGDSGEGVPQGLLKANSVIIFNTSNTSAEREDIVFGDPLENLWKTCIFALCGVKSFYRKMFRIMVTSTFEQRKQWLTEVEEIVSDIFLI
ncbi:NAD(P)H-dependent oxidoreductase [bacterium]